MDAKKIKTDSKPSRTFLVGRILQQKQTGLFSNELGNMLHHYGALALPANQLLIWPTVGINQL
jgi:hypothetical protein